jgi:hypothetical protein
MPSAPVSDYSYGDKVASSQRFFHFFEMTAFHSGRGTRFLARNWNRAAGVTSDAPSSERPRDVTGVFNERHYSVEEIAELWQLSRDAISRLFKDEPGVFVLPGPGSRVRKRPYKTLRIPESVVRRVHKRFSLS